MARYELKIRVSGKVSKIAFASEDELFAKLTDELATQVDDADNMPLKSPIKDYEAVELVHSRLEVGIGEGLFKSRHGGIDVRRDGSAEGWIGRSNKTLIESRPGESLPDALRRELRPQ